MRDTQKLKQIVARREAVIVPGAGNPFFARIIEQVGYPVLYVTGAGVANMQLGLPDLGLSTVTELASTVSAISDVVDLPLIVDIDTGFGNPLNMVRTVRLLERAGAAALQVEDQVFPKKCGHFEGKNVISVADMVHKIKAATDSRVDQDMMIIARTDARAVEGLSAAIDRGHAYVEAGADMIFVEAPQSVEELRQIGSAFDVPQVANIVHGGKTPNPGHAALADAGFSIVLYANAALQASLWASTEVLTELRKTGTLQSVSHMIADFEDRQSVLKKSRWDDYEVKYS